MTESSNTIQINLHDITKSQDSKKLIDYGCILFFMYD